jgi:[ribosomal protein S18]-alanine N-acetyltransferase
MRENLPRMEVPGSAKVEVRRAIAADLDRVMEIERQSAYGAHWTRAAYTKYECEPRDDLFHRSMLVAVEGENIVGFAAASFLEGDDAALLENLAVDSKCRRRGVAKALCAATIEWAKSEGAWGLDLEVRVSNAVALALYESLRFVEQGRRRRYYTDPEEDGVLMGLRFR